MPLPPCPAHPLRALIAFVALLGFIALIAFVAFRLNDRGPAMGDGAGSEVNPDPQSEIRNSQFLLPPYTQYLTPMHRAYLFALVLAIRNS